MASALAAFARSLGANGNENRKAKQDDEEDAQLVDSEDEEQEANTNQTGQESDRPRSLAEVAQTNNSAKPTSTLVNFAKQQDQQQPSTPTLSLLQVAQQEDQAVRLSSRDINHQKLTMIAAQVNEEDAEVAKQRNDMIQSALQTTSEEMRAQVQAKQRQAIELAVQQAIVEEQQYQQDDEFEAEEDDPAIRNAAQMLIAKVNATVTSNNNNNNNQTAILSVKPRALALSVDRHVLKQRQHRHGLQSTSTSKAKTMKDKLSSFQFHQLSLTQRRLFLATLVGDNNAAHKNKKCNMDAIHELAKNKAKLQKSKRTKKPGFAKLDDNRNCRFKPRFFTGGQQRDAKSKGNTSSDDEDNNNTSANQRNEDFVRRMEAAERAKNEQLRRTREEQAYLARVDKKECPMCGNSQSYSELSQKRKKCPNCGVTYKNRVAWNGIANQFLERMEQYLDAKLEAKRKREEQQLRECEPHRNHHHIKHRHRLKGADLIHFGDNNDDDDGDTTKTWEEVQDEFLGRVQLDLMHRELSKDAILQELQKECSFTPVISTKAKRLNLGTFDERLRRDLESRKARQEQYKILAGAIAAASAAPGKAGIGGTRGETRLVNKTKRVPGLPPLANFQERLRLDLEKRREREQDNNFDARQQQRNRVRPKQTQIKW